MRLDPIEIQPYDARWPKSFAGQRARIEECLSDWLTAPIEHCTHHLHVVEEGSADWRDWILFRDYLRSHSLAVERYGDLKRSLAKTDSVDRVRYRAGKTELIEELVQEARAWRGV